MITFARLSNRYVVTCKFKANGGWHIGTGTPAGDTDAPVVKERDQPFIPGSSLRGALRAAVERVMRSLDLPAARNVCTLFEESPTTCVASAKKTREPFEGEEADTAFARLKDGKLRLCAVCQLFGSTVMAAKLKVGGARSVKALGTVVRDGVGINRDTGSAQDKLKYDYEVAEGGEFECELQLENGTLSDFALLFVLLKEWQHGIDIGGRKARGLGRMNLWGGGVEYFDGDRGYSLLDYLASDGKEESIKTFLPWLQTKFEEFAQAKEESC